MGIPKRLQVLLHESRAVESDVDGVYMQGFHLKRMLRCQTCMKLALSKPYIRIRVTLHCIILDADVGHPL